MAYHNNLKFSHNWNNKLSCASWTTLRKWNEKKYTFGQVYNVYLNDELVGTAQLIGKRRTLQSGLNEFVARLDTGYSLAQCQSIINRMYGAQTDHDLGLYLFKWVTVEKTASINVKHLRKTIDDLRTEVAALQGQLQTPELFTEETDTDDTPAT